jgi:hypothetical protein
MLIPEKQIAVNAKTKAIAAAQTAASGAIGLVRSTSATAADLVPVGATGLDSIAAGTPLEGRATIKAGWEIYAGSTYSSGALPTSAAEGAITYNTAGVVYEWGNGAWRAKDDLTLKPIDRLNAARGMVYNGGSVLPLLTDPATPTKKRVPGCSGIYRYLVGGAAYRDIFANVSDKRYGGYSLSTVGQNIVAYDDPFPVVAGIIYGCWGAIKQSTSGANFWYQALLALDDDGLLINPPNYRYVANTNSVLSVALVSGATTISIRRFRDHPGTASPVANWVPSLGYATIGTVGVFNYSNAAGFTYPTPLNETAQNPVYTRNSVNYVTPIVTSGSDFVLTLQTAYTGATIAAGTPVANMIDGGAFTYPNSNNYNTDTTWLQISPNMAAGASNSTSGLFAVQGSYGVNASINPLPPWAAKVVPAMLLSYGANNTTTSSWHFDIYPIP